MPRRSVRTMAFVGMLVLILGSPEGLYARKGDYDRAIRDYSEATRLDPDDPHALIGRGFVYCRKHEFDRAVRDFDAALGICPTCPLAISGRAAAYVGKECR